MSRSPRLHAMGLFGFNLFGTKEGCKLAPKEAPNGLKLATFAGKGRTAPVFSQAFAYMIIIILKL